MPAENHVPRYTMTFFFFKDIDNTDRKQVLIIWECFFKTKSIGCHLENR